MTFYEICNYLLLHKEFCSHGDVRSVSKDCPDQVYNSLNSMLIKILNIYSLNHIPLIHINSPHSFISYFVKIYSILEYFYSCI